MARILVVDDEDDIRLLVRFELEAGGHQVIEAGSGAVGLERVLADRPDLVLLDVMMPGVNGWAVLEQIKSQADPAVREIPVVMLTALEAPLDRVKGGIEGAVRYLTKPMDLDDLSEAVTAALASPEAPQRRAAQQQALEMLARIEANTPAGAPRPGPRPRLSRLERGPTAAAPAPGPLRVTPERMESLTEKQRGLLELLGRLATVMEVAAELGTSRSNIYASLRRISRKLGVRSVTELLGLVRSGSL
ncbi:MAG: response regulator [Acidimicrobiia bacterium]